MDAAVYLDHNATTPIRPEALASLTETLSGTGNPSSVHRFGRAARRRIEDAREQVASLIGAPAPAVVFTSGGTEANALALRGCGARQAVVSAVEHPSVLAAPDAIALRLPVDRDGVIDLDALDGQLSRCAGTVVVSIMLANNETGVIQPVAAAAAIARRHGACVHCDAVQAAGKVPVDFAALGVHMLSVSAHKLGGPPGVGALVVVPELPLAPGLRGGGQERGRRAGTENVAGIAAFGAAAAAAGRDLDAFAALAVLRDRLEDRVRTRVPGARVFGAGAPRLPNTSCLSLPDVPAEAQVMALDLAGIAVSAGAACSSGKTAASHVLKAMGADRAGEAIRVSLGWTSGPADVDRFVDAWAGVLARAA